MNYIIFSSRSFVSDTWATYQDTTGGVIERVIFALLVHDIVHQKAARHEFRKIGDKILQNLQFTFSGVSQVYPDLFRLMEPWCSENLVDATEGSGPHRRSPQMRIFTRERNLGQLVRRDLLQETGQPIIVVIVTKTVVDGEQV